MSESQEFLLMNVSESGMYELFVKHKPRNGCGLISPVDTYF